MSNTPQSQRLTRLQIRIERLLRGASSAEFLTAAAAAFDKPSPATASRRYYHALAEGLRDLARQAGAA